MAIKKKTAKRRPYKKRDKKEKLPAKAFKERVNTALKQVLTEMPAEGRRRLPENCEQQAGIAFNDCELRPEPHTPEETFNYVLTLIRQYSPEEQNHILQQVIKELAYDRENLAEGAAKEAERHKISLSSFLEITAKTSQQVLEQRHSKV